MGPPTQPIAIDAPFEFPTTDPDGNPLEEGKVFYQNKVMIRRVAEQLERLKRGLRGMDRPA